MNFPSNVVFSSCLNHKSFTGCTNISLLGRTGSYSCTIWRGKEGKMTKCSKDDQILNELKFAKRMVVCFMRPLFIYVVCLQGVLQRVADIGLGILIPVHSQIALNSVASDYIPKGTLGMLHPRACCCHSSRGAKRKYCSELQYCSEIHGSACCSMIKLLQLG